MFPTNAPGGTGVAVQFVLPGSNAAQSGLQAGDVITSLDGQLTPNVTALNQVLNGRRGGTTVPVTVQRAGQTVTFQLTLDV